MRPKAAAQTAGAGTPTIRLSCGAREPDRADRRRLDATSRRDTLHALAVLHHSSESARMRPVQTVSHRPLGWVMNSSMISGGASV